MQHRGGRDRLGDAGGAEERVKGYGLAGLEVGQAVAPGNQQLAVLGNRQGPAGNSAGLEGLVHDVVEDGHPLADRDGARFGGRGRIGRAGAAGSACGEEPFPEREDEEPHMRRGGNRMLSHLSLLRNWAICAERTQGSLQRPAARADAETNAGPILIHAMYPCQLYAGLP